MSKGNSAVGDRGRFGPNSVEVQEFLSGIEKATSPQWRDLYVLAAPTRLTLGALRALTQTRLAASADSAVERAVRESVRHSSLDPKDLPDETGVSRILTSAIAAAAALAVGDQLTSEHREALLEPFREAEVYPLAGSDV